MFTNVAYLHNSLADLVTQAVAYCEPAVVITVFTACPVVSRSDSTDERIISFYTLQRAKVIFILTDHSDKKPLLLKEI